MSRAYASAVIPLDVERVWGYVRDFGKLAEWHPGIAECSIEGGEPGDAVGGVRYLKLVDGAEIRERLLQMNDVERSYTYNFVESAFPVRSYVSTIRFTPVTDQGHTFADWWADFDADADVEPELLTTFGDDVFATGLAALRDRLTAG
jgi:hypothetical protein